MLQPMLYLLTAAILTIMFFFMTMSSTMYQSHTSRQEIPEELSHLSPQQYRVLYENKTEPEYSSQLVEEDRPGIYVTADTGLIVFDSSHKFGAETGLLGFTEAVEENVYTREVSGLFSSQIEVRSRDTSAYLGELLDGGPGQAGQHYSINGSALEFIPDDTAGEAF
ncbi:MAG: peptide-methionine (R)-S-oxide reductase [Patescibacteria group bacterium]